MNAFASYGASAASRDRKKRGLSALDLKFAEKQRLSRAYKAMVRKDRVEAFQQEPRLRDFMRWLRHQNEPHELIAGIAESWLLSASSNVRTLALRLINRHCDRLNRFMGNEALDDPLPPEKSVYFHCRDLLHTGGRS